MVAALDHSTYHELIHVAAAIILVSTGVPLIVHAGRSPRVPARMGGLATFASIAVVPAVGLLWLAVLIAIGAGTAAHQH